MCLRGKSVTEWRDLEMMVWRPGDSWGIFDPLIKAEVVQPRVRSTEQVLDEGEVRRRAAQRTGLGSVVWVTQYRLMPVIMVGSPEGGHVWSMTRNSAMDLFRGAVQEARVV